MNITKTRNTSVKTDQNPSLERNNSTDSTNKNQIQDDLSPDDFSDSEESLAMTIELQKNQTTLQSDSIPVSSDGDGEIEAYDPDDKVPKNVTDNGNSAEGDDGEL
ncbi:5261_t:CDS:2 [Rhizophagus irregularis]|nr:5261_t:CDS:2 [Rhizophagus irregularis]